MRAALILAAVLAACANLQVQPATEIVDGSDSGGSDSADWIDVHVRFEPVLAEAGILIVELRLPPGPASLRLVVGGEVTQQPIVVRVAAEFEFRTARTTPEAPAQS